MSFKDLKLSKGRFVGIPYDMVNTKEWLDLSAHEVKLLFDLMTQYVGNNNGVLSPCHTLMRERNWAKTTLFYTFNALVHKGFLVVTRQGRKTRGVPTLVAVTFKGIDEPRRGVEYDGGIVPHHTPLNQWCKAQASWKHKPRTKRAKRPTKKENVTVLQLVGGVRPQP